MGIWIELGVFLLVFVFAIHQFHDLKQEKRKREAAQEQLRQMPTGFAFGDSKPGKRDRRAIRRLKGDG